MTPNVMFSLVPSRAPADRRRRGDVNPGENGCIAEHETGRFLLDVWDRRRTYPASDVAGCLSP